MEIGLKRNYICDIAIAPADDDGKPAPVDGAPEWSSSDETIAKLTMNADGLSGTVESFDALGSAVITVKCDADLGSGVETIEESATVTVSTKAVGLGLSVGTPRPK